MAGLVSAIHVFEFVCVSKTWMPGTRPGMRGEGHGRWYHFIVSMTFCSAAVSCGSIDLATARAQARNSGWFLSMATPTGCAFSVLSWQLLALGSTASPFTLWLIGT